MALSRTTLPQRTQTPLFGSPTPIVVLGLIAAVCVGALVAKNLALGVAALLGLLYAPVVLLHLVLGVTLWIPIIFLERVPAAGRGPSAISILVGIAWLATVSARRELVGATLRRHIALIFFFLLLLLWVSASVIWSVAPGATVRTIGFWWIAGGVFVVVATTLTERRYLEMACIAFVVGAVLSIVVGPVLGATVPSDVLGTPEAGRFAGTYGDPNFLAAGLVPAMALTAGLASVIRPPAWRLVLLAAAICLAIGLLATGSRGGALAAIAAAFAALLVARGRRLSIIAAAVAFVLIGGLWVATTSTSTLNRIHDFGTGSGRTDLWTIALRMGDAQPINGVGIAAFPEASAQYLRRPGRLPSGQLGSELILQKPHQAHNTYLQLYAETGLVGLALFTIVVLAAMRATWMAARIYEREGDSRFAALAWSVLIAQVAVMIASTFISDPFDKRTWVLLALGPAFLAVASRPSFKDLPHAS